LIHSVFAQRRGNFAEYLLTFLRFARMLINLRHYITFRSGSDRPRARTRNSPLLIFAGENSTIIARGNAKQRGRSDGLIRAYFPAGNEAGRANSPGKRKFPASEKRAGYIAPLSLFLTFVNFDASSTESSVERAVIGRNRRCIILFGRIIIAVIRANGAPQQIRLRGSCPAR